VFRRAAHKAAQDVKLDTLANAMIVVFGQLLLSVVFWFLYNYTWPSGTITTRLAAPFLLFPVAFIVRFIGVPPELAKENAAHLASLENFAIPNQRRKEIKDTIGRFIAEGNEIFSSADRTCDTEKLAQQWATKVHNFIESALGTGEATLFLNDFGYTFYSSDGITKNYIKGRIIRLNDLLPRVDTMCISKNSDSVPSM
jgi:hypothetical protein